MWQYRIFHLDPAVDLDQAIEAYASEGWELWAPGRGAKITVNGQLVHVLNLRRWSDSNSPRSARIDPAN